MHSAQFAALSAPYVIAPYAVPEEPAALQQHRTTQNNMALSFTILQHFRPIGSQPSFTCDLLQKFSSFTLFESVFTPKKGSFMWHRSTVLVAFALLAGCSTIKKYTPPSAGPIANVLLRAPENNAYGWKSTYSFSLPDDSGCLEDATVFQPYPAQTTVTAGERPVLVTASHKYSNRSGDYVLYCGVERAFRAEIGAEYIVTSSLIYTPEDRSALSRFGAIYVASEFQCITQVSKKVGGVLVPDPGSKVSFDNSSGFFGIGSCRKLKWGAEPKEAL